MSHRHSPIIAIRHAGPDDAATLRRLAALDSARPLRGEVLLAVVDGEPWAAISLRDRRVVADPFLPSGPAVELLAVRAAQRPSASAARPASRARWRLGLA